MRFFSISYSDELDEIGYHPQTEIEAKSFSYVSIGSVQEVKRNVLDNRILDITLLMDNRSNATDLLYNTSITFGFVISPRFKAILETCHLPPHRFYPIKVEHKGMSLDYFWFHHIADIYRHIDLMASSVTIFHKFNFKIIENLKIESLEKIKKLKSSLPFDQGMRFNEVVLKRDFPDYDVFDLTDIQFVPLISERLLDKLQSAKLTGYQAKSYESIKSPKS